MNRFWKIAAAGAALAAVPTMAQAHPGLAAAGFPDGFIHPFTGADHIMAMVAVGYWAQTLGGKARWAVPASFTALMALGAVFGFHSSASTLVEYGVAASVFALGLLVAFEVKLPVLPAAALVGFFAFFHGYSHGSEAPSAAVEAWFFGGFTLATLILQGIGQGLAALRFNRVVSRLAGISVALGGLYLIAGV